MLKGNSMRYAEVNVIPCTPPPPPELGLARHYQRLAAFCPLIGKLGH